LIKITYLRTGWLEINISLYCLLRGSRAIYCSEKNPRSRIRGVRSDNQVIGKDTISLFYFYYLWEFFFVSFLLLYCCFVILIRYSRTQKRHHNIILPSSLSVALELKGYLSDWVFIFTSTLCKNSIKLLSKKYLSSRKTWIFTRLGV